MPRTKKTATPAPQKNAMMQEYGRMAKGAPKSFSPEEIAKRKRRLAAARARSPRPPRLCACGQPVGDGVGDGLCIECRFAGLPQPQTE
jgi:hypothetical protein